MFLTFKKRVKDYKRSKLCTVSCIFNRYLQYKINILGAFQWASFGFIVPSFSWFFLPIASLFILVYIVSILKKGFVKSGIPPKAWDFNKSLPSLHKLKIARIHLLEATSNKTKLAIVFKLSRLKLCQCAKISFCCLYFYAQLKTKTENDYLINTYTVSALIKKKL